jgi:GNAT superfamily N-acetyltransferase
VAVVFPDGYRLAALDKDHPRRDFRSGVAEVDHWLATKALQHQKRRLSTTKVLLDGSGHIAGFYTLATGQVDFGDLPAEVIRKLPRCALPVAILAWLGVRRDRQGSGLGKRLFAQALADCHHAGEVFAFVAVILDCLNEQVKAFYQHWGFQELPGNPYRLFISAAQLTAMMTADND